MFIGDCNYGKTYYINTKTKTVDYIEFNPHVDNYQYALNFLFSDPVYNSLEQTFTGKVLA
jgi:hypothetical protein